MSHPHNEFSVSIGHVNLDALNVQFYLNIEHITTPLDIEEKTQF